MTILLNKNSNSFNTYDTGSSILPCIFNYAMILGLLEQIYRYRLNPQNFQNRIP
jgi:hypothetical protein